MSPTDYKQRHPLAWIVIGAVVLFAAAAAASMKGLLPFGPQPEKVVCNECGVVEAVRTVETPALPETALEQSVTDDATSATAAAAATGAPGTEPGMTDPAAAAMVSYSYETTVRYENGTTGVFNQADPPSWAPGDKVKVVDGLIVLAS